MNLNIFDEIKNNIDSKISDFISELSESLNGFKEKEEINNNRDEECLYHVIDSDKETVYLQNLNTNITFKETDLPEEIKRNVFTDCFLRYRNGQYIWEKELTEKYWNTLVSPIEYQEIQEKFIKESEIQENNPNTKYFVKSYEDGNDYTILSYESNGIKEIKVPNVLMPFGVNNKKIYKFKEGKFELYI